ncbi:Crp/Fnr family transcriptional regulator [Sphingobacterium sp. MYb382]|uniref:Crp/Fnr family transcriptional regulator n=1 Tax=Sphingobacterium sp. MYb382 TaxID=2745278 RepID=UPI00309A54DD
MNPLIEQLKKYGYLSEKLQEEIAKRTQFFSKNKYEHLLREGQIMSSYFVISKGIIRSYFHANGKEVNSWFGEENEIFCSVLPLYKRRPSFENIQFLEDSELYILSVEDLDAIYQQFPEFNLIGRLLAEEVCIIMEERITSLHTEFAIERYHSLIKKQPKLLNRINLGHIASYLGITAETLSRIRR